MQLPNYQGAECLATVGEQAFPLYAQPTVKGVEIMIRHGRVHFVGRQVPFKNLSIKNLFFDIFAFTRKCGFSVHAKLSSATVSDSELVAMLSSHKAVLKEEAVQCYHHELLLPNDIELVVTDIIVEQVAEHMKIEERTVMMNHLNRDILKTRGLKAVAPTYCHDEQALNAILESFSTENETMIGVRIFQPGSTYIEGIPQGLPTAIVINLSTEELAEVVSHELPECVSEDAVLHGTFDVRSDRGVKFAIPAELLTSEAMSDIGRIKEALIGQTIALSTLQLPHRKVPVCRSINIVGFERPQSTFRSLYGEQNTTHEIFLPRVAA